MRRSGSAGVGRGVREAGSGTVLAIGALLVIVTAAVAALTLVAVVASTHRARSAADLAALAAAGDLVRTGSTSSACGRAAALASRSGAVLTGCHPDPAGGDVVVEVVVGTPPLARRLGVGQARATARAGPAGADPRGRTPAP